MLIFWLKLVVLLESEVTNRTKIGVCGVLMVLKGQSYNYLLNFPADLTYKQTFPPQCHFNAQAVGGGAWRKTEAKEELF